jgi:lysophospholipase L1-like esterase
MKPRSWFSVGVALMLSLGTVASTVWAGPSDGVPKRGNARFFELHAAFLKRAAAGPVGVLFLGDSITEGWTKVPELWESAWGKYEPANFGIGGDQTQHVIWRIEQAELEKISPKVVVLMIGTNNTGRDAAEEIAAADRKIVAMIREALPETKILLLAIFPRGPRMQRDGTPEPWEMRMEKIAAVNADLATLDDGKTIRFLDIGPKFYGPDGTIPKEIMPDQLHPNAAGYQIWVDAMSPLLAEMMGQ